MALLLESPPSRLCDPSTMKRPQLCDRNDNGPRKWTPESVEPALPASSGDSEQCSLACEEDGSSLELPELAIVEPAESDSAPSSFPGFAAPKPYVFSPADTRDAIRNELYRQEELQYLPERPEARRFASTDRPRVVSWLVEVVSALSLSDETLHVAVSLLDRFIALTEAVPPEHVLQLLALACISLAAKHEEVSQVRVDDWVGLAVDQHGNPLYQRADLQRMEWLLLETVEWRIRVPNTLTFLRHCHHALADNPACRDVLPEKPGAAATFKACANFLAELSLMYDAFLPYGYSTIAVGCLVLAEWTAKSASSSTSTTTSATAAQSQSPPPVIRTVAALTTITGIDASSMAPNLAPCVEALHQLYSEAMTAGPGGAPPSASQLGLLSPIVARYTKLLLPSPKSRCGA
ncbi:hypothetical protein Agub_g8687 [Astrephomene gubernaculifera]|uniref:Cyclin-like domain-containing protein n=1 Tax=Astrephomene gubernaculifera TaxID=47775 RepID=A0AAD3DTU6_9CHLO|nr:hypothetical protein Agub_g8687 [Astrephomene gubernaculifera]